MSHVWITQQAPNAANVALGKGLVDNLRSFRYTSKLKKAALQVIATQLSDDHIQNLRKQFLALDQNGDGMLSAKELKEGLKRAGLDAAPDLQEIIQQVDCDGSGSIDYSEFLAASLDAKMYIQEDVCWSAFCVFDKNGDGQIT